MEGELSQESGMQQVQEFQSPRELRQQQQALDLLETWEVEAGLGAEAY